MSVEKEALNILKAYFLLMDAYDDGIKMLNTATDNPQQYIKTLEKETKKSILDIWDKILRRQSLRLFTINEYISSQDYLTFLDSSAQEKITTIIGYKMDRVATLHGLGAGLFFRKMFGSEEEPETTASFVHNILTMNDGTLIDKTEILNELAEFKKAIIEFQSIATSLIEKKELIKLSKQAREETRDEIKIA